MKIFGQTGALVRKSVQNDQIKKNAMKIRHLIRKSLTFMDTIVLTWGGGGEK